MAFACETITAETVDTIVGEYETFLASETVITCTVDGQLRLPAAVKVRYYALDPDGYGHFAVAIRDAAGALVSIALCNRQSATEMFLSHWVLVDRAQDFTSIGIAGGQFLASLGYDTCTGVATGEMGRRVTKVPAVAKDGPDLMTLDLTEL